MKAIHAINAVLWQPGEQILKLQTDKQTDKPNDYYTRGRPRAPRVIMLSNNASAKINNAHLHDQPECHGCSHNFLELPSFLPTPTCVYIINKNMPGYIVPSY